MDTLYIYRIRFGIGILTHAWQFLFRLTHSDRRQVQGRHCEHQGVYRHNGGEDSQEGPEDWPDNTLQMLSTRDYIVQPSLNVDVACLIILAIAMDSCHYQFIQIGHSMKPIHLPPAARSSDPCIVFCRLIHVTLNEICVKSNTIKGKNGSLFINW